MIEILDFTKEPLEFIGKVAGVCWGANLNDKAKNKARGIECIENNHGRVMEYADVVMIIDEYSSRVIRELYTSQIGNSKLQASTRYIDYSDFNYYVPPTIEMDFEARKRYDELMQSVKETYTALLGLGVPKEDIGNILPLGSTTKMVLKINLRALQHLFHIRMCGRAYVEFRALMREIKSKLSGIDDDWKYICDHFFVPKCVAVGYCDERYQCSWKLKPKKGEL